MDPAPRAFIFVLQKDDDGIEREAFFVPTPVEGLYRYQDSGAWQNGDYWYRRVDDRDMIIPNWAQPAGLGCELLEATVPAEEGQPSPLPQHVIIPGWTVKKVTPVESLLCSEEEDARFIDFVALFRLYFPEPDLTVSVAGFLEQVFPELQQAPEDTLELWQERFAFFLTNGDGVVDVTRFCHMNYLISSLCTGSLTRRPGQVIALLHRSLTSQGINALYPSETRLRDIPSNTFILQLASMTVLQCMSVTVASKLGGECERFRMWVRIEDDRVQYSGVRRDQDRDVYRARYERISEVVMAEQHLQVQPQYLTREEISTAQPTPAAQAAGGQPKRPKYKPRTLIARKHV